MFREGGSVIRPNITSWKPGDRVMGEERKILRKPAVIGRVGLSAATIYRLEKGGLFPQRVRLGGNSCGWFLDEISAWLRAKADDRNGG